jgi:hypothetical protein
MTGDALPYHLRPHKAVDRRLFLDLLGRFERWQPLDEHVYLSMGAYPMEDHKLVHRLIGLKRLIAFDMDGAVVARQRFNRPIDVCHCIEKKAEEVVEQIEAILQSCRFRPDANVVVWLDYTSPHELGKQIREFRTLLGKLRSGDVVRVTVNAQPIERRTESDPNIKPEKIGTIREKRFEKLKNDIGDFLPSTASPNDVTFDGYPKMLAEAFGNAALEALPVGDSKTFIPLSLVRYADGQQMLSITGAVVAKVDQREMRKRLQLTRWPFGSKDWSDVHELVVPHLTLRERLFLERGIARRGVKRLIKELGFDKAGEIDIAAFLANYKKYYRFYPTLMAAEP